MTKLGVALLVLLPFSLNLMAGAGLCQGKTQIDVARCLEIVRRISQLSVIVDQRPDGPTKTDRETIDQLVRTARTPDEIAKVAMLCRVLPFPDYDPMSALGEGFWRCIWTLAAMPGQLARDALLRIGDQINFHGETEFYLAALRMQWRLTHHREPKSNDELLNKQVSRESQLHLR